MHAKFGRRRESLAGLVDSHPTVSEGPVGVDCCGAALTAVGVCGVVAVALKAMAAARK